MKADDNVARCGFGQVTDGTVDCGESFHARFVQYFAFAPKTKEIKILSAPTDKNKFEGTHTAAPGFYTSSNVFAAFILRLKIEKRLVKIYSEVWKTRQEEDMDKDNEEDEDEDSL